jgi:hypothetical protein
MPTITIHNAETGEIKSREMNAAELKQYENDVKASQERSDLEITKVNQKAALLEKLGMTAEEAKLLIQ